MKFVERYEQGLPGDVVFRLTFGGRLFFVGVIADINEKHKYSQEVEYSLRTGAWMRMEGSYFTEWHSPSEKKPEWLAHAIQEYFKKYSLCCAVKEWKSLLCDVGGEG